MFTVHVRNNDFFELKKYFKNTIKRFFTSMMWPVVSEF